MPVKKNKKISRKKTAGKTVARKANKKIKKQIREAIDNIPGLIIEHIRFPQPAITQTDKLNPVKNNEIATVPENIVKKNYSGYDYKTEKNKRPLLWLGVLTITLIILAMWAWNLKTIFYDASQMKKNNPAPWQTVKDDFSAIMKNAEEDSSKIIVEDKKNNQPEINLELKNNLKKSLLAIIANSTNTSSTQTSSTQAEQ